MRSLHAPCPLCHLCHRLSFAVVARLAAFAAFCAAVSNRASRASIWCSVAAISFSNGHRHLAARLERVRRRRARTSPCASFGASECRARRPCPATNSTQRRPASRFARLHCVSCLLPSLLATYFAIVAMSNIGSITAITIVATMTPIATMISGSRIVASSRSFDSPSSS